MTPSSDRMSAPAGLADAPRPDPLAPVSFGSFTFDRGNGLLSDEVRELPLPPRVLGVLDLLVSRAGAIVPKQEIIDTVWKDAFVTDTSLAEAISVLRQALGDDPQAPQYIQTVHRRGYRFVAPITALPLSRTEARSPSPQPDANDERNAPSISRQLLPWGIAALCTVLAVIAVWQVHAFSRAACTGRAHANRAGAGNGFRYPRAGARAVA